MPVIAAAAQHIRKADALMSAAHTSLKRLERIQSQESSQMHTDLQTIIAEASLAAAHISMADYIRRETLGI